MSLRPNSLYLAVLAVLIAIAGTWGSDATLAGLWRLPLGLLLLGLAYEGWVMMRAALKLRIDCQHNGVLGRAASVNLTLTHRLPGSAAVELAPDAPDSIEVDRAVQSFTIPAGQPALLQWLAVPRRMGEFKWPEVRARIAGPLGLAWWTRRLAAEFTLRVVPDGLRSVSGTHGAISSGTRSRSSLGAGAEVLQLREYRSGDPLHLIDWKATSRIGKLISRDFSEDQHLEIVVAVDVGRASALRAGALDRLGHYANITARFAEHAVAQDDRVGLVVFADQPLAVLAPGRGIASVVRIRNLLTATRLAQAESNPLNAALRIRTLVRHRSLVIMLTDLDDATVAGQLASAARLLLPKHLPLIAGLSSPQAEQLSHAPARSWLDPYEALAAQEYCARLERNVRVLRSLGAPAVLARPEQLEHAVFEAYAGFRRRRRV